MISSVTQFRVRKTIGALIISLCCVWIVIIQGLFSALPITVASDAPAQYLPNQEDFTKEQAYDFAFSIAKDIRNKSPNLIFPSAWLLFGSWLFFGCRPPTRVTIDNAKQEA
jgi:hypothetical protein